MNDDERIEALLMEQFEGPVPDDGFCDRAMQSVPTRRRRYAWPLAVGAVAGGALCWWSLISLPLLRIGWRDWMAGEFSPSAITLLVMMAGLSLLALAWTALEAGDR